VKLVGRYQIVEELGRGAMGTVYKALDPAIGRTIAIKTIRLTDFTDADERQRIRERLLREAQSAGVLSHPNIVTIYDVLEEGEYAYIFMEYVSGKSLEKLFRSQSLPKKSALLKYLVQVADALD
jgi:eukaryotic-like serine/threonine-protein kinase